MYIGLCIALFMQINIRPQVRHFLLFPFTASTFSVKLNGIIASVTLDQNNITVYVLVRSCKETINGVTIPQILKI